MVKIKIFDFYNTNALEKEVNNWLADHRYSDILNIQYSSYKDGYVHFTACVTYRDGS